MVHYFMNLIKSGSVFWFCALAGTGMFLIQFLINVFGMSEHDSFDSSDVSSDSAADGSQDSADARKFKWLSM